VLGISGGIAAMAGRPEAEVKERMDQLLEDALARAERALRKIEKDEAMKAELGMHSSRRVAKVSTVESSSSCRT
jgi:hypothetical protein